MSLPKLTESGIGPVPLASEVEAPVALDPAPASPRGEHSSDALIRRGFFAAVIFSMVGFCTVAVYLFYFAFQMNAAFAARSVGALHSLGTDEELQILFVHVAVWHFGLQSCGVMAGVVLGFLGLARGEEETPQGPQAAEGAYTASHQVSRVTLVGFLERRGNRFGGTLEAA